MSSTKSQILVVDDDNLVLKIFRNSIDEREYEFVPAVSGEVALEYLKDPDHRIKVVVSDMLMPGMDGLELLGLLQKRHPDITRVLLTGSDDIAYISEVINQVDIFRFVRKPIQPTKLNKTLRDAVDYHEMIVAERDIMESTLAQSLDALFKILEMTNGIAYALTRHVKEYSLKLGKLINVPRLWSLEISAQMSQLGCITIPEFVLERYYWGDDLSPKETAMVKNQANIGRSILMNIPRLEHIGETIIAAHSTIDSKLYEEGDATTVHAAIIKLATEFDMLVRRGRTKEEALESITENPRSIPVDLIEAFSEIDVIQPKLTTIDLEIDKIKNGMWIEEDVKTHEGVLIVSKGYRINEAVRNRLVNFSDEGEIDHMIKVRVDR